MCASTAFHSPAEAARQIGLSAKALRLYEQRGLVAPLRDAAGWRHYGPAQMARLNQIAMLRRLGLSLAGIARVLEGDSATLAAALAAHQAGLEGRMRDLAGQAERLRGLRAGLAAGAATPAEALAGLAAPWIALDLPWPWGGERFELAAPRPLVFLTGPLGSGKTRLGRALAAAVPGGAFLGLDRRLPPGLVPGDAAASLAWLAEDGATPCPALECLLAALAAEGPRLWVVDMVEQGLDAATQQALVAHLRRRGPAATPLVLMTRSCAILDLPALEEAEAVLFCPASHAPPLLVPPCPGAPGQEAVASCLAPPEVRARTEGMVAVLPGRC